MIDLKCEITTATVSRVYVKNQINFISVKRDDNGIEIEDVHILTPMAGLKFGVVCVPPQNQQVVIAVLNPQTQQSICLGCLYNISNPPPYQIQTSNSQIFISYGQAWQLEIESQSGKEELKISTKNQDTISIDQSKRLFTLKSQDGKNVIEMDCTQGSLNISAMKEINIEVPQNNYIKINNQGVTISGSTSIKADAGNIAIKAKTQANFEGATTTVKGSAQTSIG